MKALVIAQNADSASLLCAGARSVADEVILAFFTSSDKPVPTQVSDKAYGISVPEANIISDAYITINNLFDAEKPKLVLVEPTRDLKSIAGRLGAHLGTAVVTNCMSFEANSAVNRYYGGVGERTYSVLGEHAIYTISPVLFADNTPSGTDLVEELEFVLPARAVVRLGSNALPANDSNLASADTVVCVGRGIDSADKLDIARSLASKLGGEMACTRPLTEGLDLMPKGTYLGVSGLTIKPKVYFGVGISGQAQHMVGCNNSGVIIAINKDKNAAIFKQCDIGIVGDLATVLPELSAAL